MKYGFDYTNSDNMFTMLVFKDSGTVDIQNCEYKGKKTLPERKKLQPKQPKLFRDIEASVLNRVSKTQGFQTEIEGSVRTHNAAKRPSKAISKPKQ